MAVPLIAWLRLEYHCSRGLKAHIFFRMRKSGPIQHLGFLQGELISAVTMNLSQGFPELSSAPVRQRGVSPASDLVPSSRLRSLLHAVVAANAQSRVWHYRVSRSSWAATWMSLVKCGNMLMLLQEA